MNFKFHKRFLYLLEDRESHNQKILTWNRAHKRVFNIVSSPIIDPCTRGYAACLIVTELNQSSYEFILKQQTEIVISFELKPS